MLKIEVIADIEGFNRKGQMCNPYKMLKGTKAGFYSAVLSSDNTKFRPFSEGELRKLIVDGEFDRPGARIRMIPKGATSTASASAMRPKRYQGRAI